MTEIVDQMMPVVDATEIAADQPAARELHLVHKPDLDPLLEDPDADPFAFNRNGTESAQCLTRTVLHSLTRTSSSTDWGASRRGARASLPGLPSRVSARQSASVIAPVRGPARLDSARRLRNAQTIVRSRRDLDR